MTPALLIAAPSALLEERRDAFDTAPWRLAAHVPQALALLRNAGYALVAVLGDGPASTPGGVPYDELGTRLQALLQKAAGVDLTGFHVCPHARRFGGPESCPCRYPAQGLLQRAALTHGLDLHRSWMVGASLDAVEAGRRSGCRSVLLDREGGLAWARSPMRTPHLRCCDLLQAARYIVAAEVVPAACTGGFRPRASGGGTAPGRAPRQARMVRDLSGTQAR